MTPFKRAMTPAGKLQAFGFVIYDDPDSLSRALQLLAGIELPSLEPGQAGKALIVRLFYSGIVPSMLIAIPGQS